MEPTTTPHLPEQQQRMGDLRRAGFTIESSGKGGHGLARYRLVQRW